MLIRRSTALIKSSFTFQCCSKNFHPTNNLTRFIHTSARLFDEEDSANERPQMFQLEHVQKRIECCIPLMFRTKLDYTFYRKDVILDDQIFGAKLTGLDAYMNYIATLNFIVNFSKPYADFEALNIIPLLDDGTVRLRWRVRYQTWLTALSLRNIMGKLDFEKSLKWYDGYSIFVVDGDGFVSKVTLQKSMPDDDKTLLNPKKLAEKIVRKAQPATNPSVATEDKF